ncbi:hypothetical protein EDF73_101468 [Raoultella sp. BIGb0138]|nr:hypothetical protein EDF73_101468 [Raoultella sp. BIGb0138]
MLPVSGCLDVVIFPQPVLFSECDPCATHEIPNFQLSVNDAIPLIRVLLTN